MIAVKRPGGVLHGLGRAGAGIVGGYAFTYGYAALATFSGFAVGLPFSDARTLAWLTAPLVFLVAILWAFVPRRAVVAWVVLAGGGAAMGAAAWALSRTAT